MPQVWWVRTIDKDYPQISIRKDEGKEAWKARTIVARLGAFAYIEQLESEEALSNEAVLAAFDAWERVLVSGTSFWKESF